MTSPSFAAGVELVILADGSITLTGSPEAVEKWRAALAPLLEELRRLPAMVGALTSETAQTAQTWPSATMEVDHGSSLGNQARRTKAVDGRSL